MSEDKVRTKDSCWSVGTIYDPRELPGVSTAGPGIGRGVTDLFVESHTRQRVYQVFSGLCRVPEALDKAVVSGSV
jgi:hypothetical protein